MKIQITGMSPRMVSGRARARISFSSLLVDALSAAQHEVVRDAVHHDDVDLLVVGVSSPLSPAATYAHNALALLARAERDGVPVVLFVDDPDLSKPRDAITSIRRFPDRLFSPFLMSKRVRSAEAFSREEVMEGIELLSSREWPTTLVPLHAWGYVHELSDHLRVESPVTPIDLSPVLDMQLRALPFHPGTHAARIWFCEQTFSKGVIAPGRSTWPPIPIKTPPSWETLDLYGTARGVFQGKVGLRAGWWTPTPLLAAKAGTVFLPDLYEGRGMGDPYYKTVDEVEHLSDNALRELADEQRIHLEEISWDMSTAFSALRDVTSRPSSFTRPDTSPEAK